MLQLAEKVEQPGITSLFLPVEDFAPLNIDLLKQGIATESLLRVELALTVQAHFVQLF